MSDFSSLGVGLSGLEAQQAGLGTVGENVANADTPGYIEEELELGAVSTQYPGFDQSTTPSAGDGVQVFGVNRLNNTYLQQRSYTEQGNEGMLSAEQSGLQAVQENFPEPSSTGVSSQLTQFWNAWSALANNPADGPTRASLVQDASSLTSSLNQTSTALSTLSQQTRQSITSTLGEVNQDASQIASLNQQILGLTAGSTSGSADQLEDQRDELISQLSNQLGVNVTYNSNGTVNVNSGSEQLVSGISSQTLSLSSSGPPYSLVWSDDQSTFQPGSGELAGMLSVVNTSIPKYQSGLDQVAQSLMGSVNNLMSTGYDLNGNSGVPFFLGTGAANIEVNPAVASNPSLIAAAASPTPAGSTATNEDGSIAAEVGEMPNSQTVTMSVPSGGWSNGGSASSWTTASTTSGTEADVAYNQLVTAVGQDTSSASTQYTNQQAVTTNVNSALQSATGVNTDQELTNMVMYQNAYDASAKFISTVDDTLQTLVSMVNG